MADQKKKAQFVAIDEDTAAEIKRISEASNMSVAQVMKSMSKMLKYAMGRRVRIESKSERSYASFDFEEYEKMVDIED